MRAGRACVTAIPLGRRLPGASSNLPGRPDLDTDPEASLARNLAPPLFGLAPGGVCRAADVAAGAVRSYRTVSPLPSGPKAERRSVLCGTVPGFASAGCYPAPLVHGARTFLPGNLSVSPKRPSGRLTCARHGDTGLSRQGRTPVKLNQDTRWGAVSVIVVRARAAMLRPPRPRPARSSCNVLRVEASNTPSTLSGRK